MRDESTRGLGADQLPEHSARESLARPESVPVQGGVMGIGPGTGERNGAGRFVKTPSLKSCLVRDIEGVPEEDRWLVDRLWSASGVGIVGATPKSGKTWLSLEMAVAVASGTPMLGEFAVPTPGPVVVFPAEDDPRAVRDRIQGLAAARGRDLKDLPLHLITETVLHLDDDDDRRGLTRLLKDVRPALVVLDPLVRLHTGAESHAGHMAELLGFLRGLQREFDCSILVTHHVSKKRGAKGGQMGQALRGSGELHAWGDSNLYLSKTSDGLVQVEVEHRSAASPDPLHFALVVKDEGTQLELREGSESEEEGGDEQRKARGQKSPSEPSAPSAPKLPLREQVLKVVELSPHPISQVAIRKQVRVRNQALTEALRELSEDGLLQRGGVRDGWRLAEGHVAPEAE